MSDMDGWGGDGTIDRTIIVVHEDYEHVLGMPCRECRWAVAKGKKLKTKKAKA